MGYKSNGKSRMKCFVPALCIALFAGCSTPNPTPGATAAVYDQIKSGMSRQQVLALLGPPQHFEPPGDVNHCQSAIWSIPHNSHGAGHWTVYFVGDTVASVSSVSAMVTLGQ